MQTKIIFENVGGRTIDFFTAIYEAWQLVIDSIKALPHIWFYRRQVTEQIYVFLVKTLPIAAVISIFVGLGAMIQGTYQ
ncbi:MAG: hypothetical protein GQ545_06035, partial [Candidatus Aminicenantes bacterium]|nr:hypothetical protein [Candidatus Aminicenantes bacterium]